jgi:hypothetical protein
MSFDELRPRSAETPIDIIVAHFHDYGAAQQALCELEQNGLPALDATLIAGDHSDGDGTPRDFGILEYREEYYLMPVRRGITLLALRLEDDRRDRFLEIIAQHSPNNIERPLGPRDQALRHHRLAIEDL